MEVGQVNLAPEVEFTVCRDVKGPLMMMTYIPNLHFTTPPNLFLVVTASVAPTRDLVSRASQHILHLDATVIKTDTLSKS